MVPLLKALNMELWCKGSGRTLIFYCALLILKAFISRLLSNHWPQIRPSGCQKLLSLERALQVTQTPEKHLGSDSTFPCWIGILLRCNSNFTTLLVKSLPFDNFFMSNCNIGWDILQFDRKKVVIVDENWNLKSPFNRYFAALK